MLPITTVVALDTQLSIDVMVYTLPPVVDFEKLQETCRQSPQTPTSNVEASEYNQCFGHHAFMFKAITILFTEMMISNSPDTPV